MPRYSLNLFSPLYFCSISSHLELRWWQQHDKNTSGLVLHIYGLHTCYGLHHNARTRQINKQTTAVFSIQSCYKRTSPFANCLKSETVCKRTEPRHAVNKRTEFSCGLQHIYSNGLSNTHNILLHCSDNFEIFFWRYGTYILQNYFRVILSLTGVESAFCRFCQYIPKSSV